MRSLLMFENLEHRHLLAALVGIDFDNDTASIPTNWTSLGTLSTPYTTDPAVNLIDGQVLNDEDGNPTAFDLTISAVGGSVTESDTDPITASTIPTHTQSLAGLDGQIFTGANAVTLTWSDLVPGNDYEVYVFGLESFAGYAGAPIEQDVTITGASSVSFRQSFELDDLFVNDQIGSNSPLSSFAKIISPDASGNITIQIDPVTLGSIPPGQTPDVSLGGLAIREVPATPELSVSINPTSVSEAAGAGAATGTVIRTSTSGDLTVDLSSDDTTEATVQATVTILDGDTSATFPIDAEDDPDPDGIQTVTITATDPGGGFAMGSATLDVVDDDAPFLTVSILAAAFSEADGAAATTATVTRNSTAGDLTVTVMSDDITEATLPGGGASTTITILNGQTTSDPFNINAINDPDDDGTQTVTITASEAGHASGSDTVAVVDDDVTVTATDLSLVITESTLAEPGVGTTATVTRPDIGLIFNHVDRGMSASDSVGSESNSNDTSGPFNPADIERPDAIDPLHQVGTNSTIDSLGFNGEGFVELIDGSASDLIEDASFFDFYFDLTAPQTFAFTGLVFATADAADASSSITLSGPGLATPLIFSEADIAGVGGGTTVINEVGTLAPGTYHFVARAEGKSSGAAANAEASFDFDFQLGTALTVNLASDPSELVHVASVTIPKDATSISFAVDPYDELVVDGDQNVTLTASASGFGDGSVPVTVTDNDSNFSTGDVLQVYRLAVAATAEFTSFFAGGVTEAFAAIQSTVSAINDIFVPELAIRLDLVSDQTIVYASAATDPYDDALNLNDLLNDNQANLDAVIGAANYDIGHVFSYDVSGTIGGGLAGLGVVGLDGSKARGATIPLDPTSTSFIDTVAHEIGHQFGAEHTFNSLVGACGSAGQYEPNSAYEVASGSTLMSYVGICPTSGGGDNLQDDPDQVFHSASYHQIQEYIANNAHAAPNSTPSNNNAIPTVGAGVDLFIPANTPFALTAAGADTDSGDVLTYSWEQLDRGPAQSLPLTDNGFSPLFRAFAPTEDPTRVFPRLDDLFSNIYAADNPDGLFNVHLLQTVGDDPGNVTTNWLTLYAAVDAAAPGATGNDFGTTNYDLDINVTDSELTFDYGDNGNFNGGPAIDTINGDGPGGGGGPFNNGNVTHYAIRGRTYMIFTAGGTYSIAMGSDDGRQISLTEATAGSAPGYTGFTAQYDQVNGTFTPGDTTIGFSGGTGHDQSVGVFTVAAGDILFLDAMFYQGTGGHSGEIMIKAGSDTDGVPGGNNSDPQAANDGWQLLSSGVEGIVLESTNPTNLLRATIGELLPTTDRELNFRATVRDGNGGVNSDDVLLNVVDTGAAFAVLFPNTAVNWTGAAQQTITWDVAGTDANGINAANVNILLSTDGGLTFPFTLATTANDGSHTITAPNINTSTARIKVEGAGNVFFDISDENFSIAANPSAPVVTLTQTDGDTRVIEGNATDTYDISLNTDPSGDVTITITADAQTEISLDGSSFASSQAVVLNSTAAQTITVRAIDDIVEEGAHTSLLTHAVTASTSAGYPVGTLIDNLVVHVTDDELPPVVGLDFDLSGQPSPTNWARQTFISSDDPTDMLRDDGVATLIDLTLDFVIPDGQLFEGAGTPVISSNSNIPRHDPVLDEIDGFAYTESAVASVVATWSDLTPGASYGVYILGAENDSGKFFSQEVTIDGATTLPSFDQVLVDGELQVNDEVGTDTRTLQSFEHVVAADSAGQIVITITPNPMDGMIPPSFGVALAGLAIREIPAPTVPAAVTVDNAVATEGGGLTFTVSLDNAVAGPFTVDVTLADVSATGGAAPLVSPEDYDNVVATLNFAGTAGETQQFTVATLDDAILESSETFTVSLNASDPLVTDTDTGTGTITDNDSAAVTVDNVTAAEGDGLTFTVSLNNAVSGPFTVDVTLSDVTATGGAAPLVSPEDYDNVVATLNFAGNAGETQQFTVATLDDAILESSETFTVSLDASDPLVTDSDTGTGTITDNDSAAVTVDNVTAAEGDGLTFTVSLDNEVAGPFTVDVTLADVSATGGAAPLVSPEDYDNVVATLNFAGNAGETQQFTVATLDDAILEGSESFSVSLDASNPLVTDSDTGTGTITDNDSAAVTVDNVTAAEGDGLTFTVSLDNEVAGPFTVDVTLADVSATGGAAPLVSPEDYDNVVATLNFAGNAGEMQQFTVATLDDAILEGSESFSVSLDASNSLVTDSDTGTGTITDNDVAGFTVTETDGYTLVFEDGSTDTFTVVLDAQPTGNVVIDVSSGDVDEATVSPSTLTFDGGNWNVPQTVTVTGVDDPDVDGDQITPITLAIDPIATVDNDFDLLPNQTVSVTTRDVDGAITGTVWEDIDGSQTQNGELGLAGVTVYLDLNHDGQFQELVEPKQVTAADGSYTFPNLAAGEYVVAQIVPTGLAQTYPQVVGTAGTFAELINDQSSVSVFATHAPRDVSRLFVVEKNSGSIRILDLKTGQLNPTPFLTIPDVDAGANEAGLLGLAFHPDYANNGKFYVNVTIDNGGVPIPGGSPSPFSTHIREYTVSADPDVADPGSVREILSFVQPQGNHNGGWIGFSPIDEFLYIATGDGGGGNDDDAGHTDPGGNAQDTTDNLLGKMLRIDVNGDDFLADPDRNYAIPPSNPFVGRTGDDEIWAYGLRNPWRDSFDRMTGDLWIGDVGQGAREEIDFQDASSTGGENYGWRLREGFIQTPGVGGPKPADNVDPVYDYQRGTGPFDGRSVVGGYVYRGQIGDFAGLYIFSDSASNYMGRNSIWSFDPADPINTVQNINDLLLPDAGSFAGSPFDIVSFGEDGSGNLYTVGIDGEIHKISKNLPGTHTVLVEAGQTVSDIDFGNQDPQASSISDFVWDDLNANGVQDAGEPGIDNVTVNLLNGTTLAQIDTTTTAGGGLYSFDDLARGDYVVEFVAPPGYLFSPQDQPPDDTDSDADPTTGRTAVITLAPSTSDDSIDAGLYQLATIGDRVWDDLNGDGIQDVGENGLVGVNVDLVGQFDDFEDGTKQGWTTGVSVTNPNAPANEASGGPAGVGDAYLEFSSAGGMGPGSRLVIRNETQWMDDFNRMQAIVADFKNFGTTNLMMRIAINGPGGWWTTTNAAAQSLPASVPAGSGDWNQLSFSLDPGSFTNVLEETSGPYSGGTDLAATLANVTELRILHNNVQAVIGGKVAAEVGIDNITAILDTDTTDANGNYSFSVEPGSYRTRFTPPGLRTFSPQDQGTDDTADSDANPANGTTAPIVVTSGENNDTIDAGMVPPPPASLTVNNAGATEGGQLTFTVSLDNAVAGPFTVDVTLTDITATGGEAPLVSPEDYDNVVATLNFAGTAGETQQFTVATLDDGLAESSETFTVSLDASNSLVTDTDTGTGTITDNDEPTLTVTIVPDAISENGGVATGTVTRNSDTTEPLVVKLISSDPGEAKVPDTVTILAGDTSVEFPVTGVDDPVVDGTVEVTVTASTTNPHEPGTATIDVLDDDGLETGVNLLPDGTLKIVGTDDRDFIFVNKSGSKLVVRAKLDGQPWETHEFPYADVMSICVVVLGGNDFVQIHRFVKQPAEILAGEGHDIIRGGGGDTKVDGGPGSDLIHTGNGRDIVTDLEGNNFIGTGFGDDEIHTGSGNDRIFSGHGGDTIEDEGGKNFVYSGHGNDVITTGDGRDLILAGSGDDWINSGGGADVVHASSGDDVVDTGDGRDRVYAGSGDDLVRGGADNDTLVGNSGNDTLLGEGGNDKIFGSSGRDLLIGGVGYDTLWGGSDDDILIGAITDHDTNDASLKEILAEWASAKSYADRVANIRAGVGGAGGPALNAMTVHDDGNKDTMSGDTDTDWFFARLEADGVASSMLDEILDLQPGEEVEDIGP